MAHSANTLGPLFRSSSCENIYIYIIVKAKQSNVAPRFSIPSAYLFVFLSSIILFDMYLLYT